MKKDFDNFSKNQSKDFYALYNQVQKELDELFESIKEDPELKKIFFNIPPWAHFYELPFSTLLASIIVRFDITEKFHNIANSTDHIQGIINLFFNPPDISKQMKILSNEEKLFLLSLVMALFYQFLSINMHGRSLSDLVKIAKDGNDDALFDAVLVDSSAVSTPGIAHRIHIAQATNDTDFKNKLAKAISDKKPKRRRPNKFDDDLRYMLAALNEQFGLCSRTTTNEKLFDLLSDELQLYPKGQKEGTVDGLQKFIQHFAKKYRT